MNRRRHAEIAREIARLKERVADYNEGARPDPWDKNPETEAAVRELHPQGERE